MTKNAWDEKRRASEEEFFNRQQQLLTAKLRKENERLEAIQHLTKASGIQDEEVLTTLFAEGITAPNLPALTLAPLVLVAWADHKVDPSERDAILQAAGKGGIEAGSNAHQLLTTWLTSPPSPTLFTTWKLYIGALKAVSDPRVYAQLGSTLMSQAQQVAQVAGGFLGLGNKISPEEARELQRIAREFS